MVTVLDIAERARDSMKQMVTKLTTKHEKYDELLGHTDRNLEDARNTYKLEQKKLQVARDKQVSCFNPKE